MRDVLPGLLLLLFGAFYLLMPLIAYFSNRILAQPYVEFIDWDNYPLPTAFRDRVDRESQQLQALGFESAKAYSVCTVSGKSEMVSFCFFHPQKQLAAAITANLLGMKNGYWLLDSFITLATTYALAEAPRLQTTSLDPLVDLGLRTQDVMFHFPHVKQVERLVDLHERLDHHYYPNTTKYSRSDQEDQAEFIQEMYREIIAAWAANDKIQPVAGEADYRFHLSTIYQACWGKWLPFGPIWKLIRYSRSRTLEREVLSYPE